MDTRKHSGGFISKVHNIRNAAFTLIELLVVISIIGLLSSVVLASVNSARDKAKDARAMADVKQISNAIELYYDQNGSYPAPSGCTTASGWYRSDTSLASGCWGVMQTALSTWMPKLPVHPDNTGNNVYAYKAMNSNTGYCIATILKNTSGPTGNGCYASAGAFCLGVNFGAGCTGTGTLQ